ncbi:putative secreted protein with PEP-CTERM sorting signal [Roseimicrobium gellanilyticum]|uniref:Putative secreted protein with PEP-CTERM sorting signal n=2 Tax=Roseimicrobium gellanilyticum TaxID=748857 RepID=A0A366HPV4_9BACT|nr:putative secreted protein with PEP-CTERM sorting signal [Roseimicrobium gellanilyticum]
MLAITFVATHASAQTFIWDANGAGTSQPNGSGQWLGAGQWWDGTNNVDWDNANPTTAQFGVTGSTPVGPNIVTITGEIIGVAGLDFMGFSSAPTTVSGNGQQYTIAGASGGTLAFGENASIKLADLSSGGSNFITLASSLSIMGNGLTIEKSGGSLQQFFSFGMTSSTLMGTLTIKGAFGGLFVRSTAAGTLASMSNIVVENGSCFSIAGGGFYNVPISIAGTGGLGQYGAIRVDASNTTISGQITLTGDAGIQTNTGGITGTVISGGITGNFGFSRFATGSGLGTLTLTGTSNYTGATTLGRASSFAGGVTILDFSGSAAPASDLLYNNVTDAGALNFIGGNNSATVLNLVGKAFTTNSQRFGAVSVTGSTSTLGGLAVVNLTSGTGGSMNLSLGNISRTGTGMIAFKAAASGAITTTMADGFLGPWATYRDGAGETSWARVSGGVVMGGFVGNLTHTTGTALSTLSGYTNTSHLTISSGSTGNVTVTSGTNDISTVSMTDMCTDRTVALGGGTLRLGATAAGGGGIQLGAKAGDLIISGGTLTGGGPTANTAGQIILTNNSTTSELRIDANITNNGTGAMMLLFNGVTGSKVVLGGTNTFTGGATIASGAVEMRSNGAFGSSGTITVLENAALQLSGGITVSRTFSVGGHGENNDGAIRNLGGNNTMSGVITLLAPARIHSDSGTLTLFNANAANNSITFGSTSSTLTFSGAGDIVVNSRINATTQAITKQGTGRLTLGGDNSVITSGAFTVSAGVLRITHASALGSTTGATTVSAGGGLELFFGSDASVAENITFEGGGFNGAGAIRSVSGNNTLSGTLSVGASGTGSITADSGTTLILSGSVRTGATSGTRTAQLGGTGTINVTGVIGNNSAGVTALTKIDSGTVNLSGANTYTGVTSVNDGMLNLNFDAAGAPATNILYNNVTLSSTVGTLTMAGGTFRATGKTNGASSQALGTLNVNGGYSRISAVSTGTGGMDIRFGAINRGAGGVVRFDLPSSGSIKTTAGSDNALLTGTGGAAFATVGADDWAATDVAVAGVRNIVGLSTINGYTASTATTLEGNADIAGSVAGTSLTVNTAINSLRFNQAQATTVTLGAGNELATGGILVTSGVGANATAIRGGGLRAGAGATDLVIIQNNTAAALTISSHLYASLTKAGAGALVIEYNAVYAPTDYSGDFRIQEGTLQLVKTTSSSIAYGLNYNSNYILGNGTSSGKIILGGAGNQSVALWGGLRIQGTGTGNAVVGGNTSLSVFHHYVSGTSDFRNGFLGGGGTNENHLSLIISQGTLQLGEANTFKGSTNMYRNTLEVTKLADRGQASSLGTGDFDANSHIIQMATLSTSATNASALATLRYIGDTDSATNRPISVTNSDEPGDVSSVIAAIENVGKGTLKFTAAFTAGGTNTVQRVLRLGGTNTGENEIVSFADASASISSKLEKTGSGKWVLTGNSTYTGGTTISAGVLQLGNGGGAGMVGAGDVAIGAGATLVMNRNNAFTVANNITGAGSVMIKHAAGGATILSSNGNTYGGGTRVNSGRLVVTNTSGSATGTGEVHVEAAGILAGTGRIAPGAGNSVIVCGTLSVGEVPAVAADLHIETSGAGTLLVEGGGAVVLDITGGAGSGMLNDADDADRLVIGGNVMLNQGSILRVQNLNGLVDWAVGDAWHIIDWTALEANRTGAFTMLDLPTLTGAFYWDTSALYTSGVIAIAVPEPGRVVLLGLAAMALVLRRGRGRRCPSPVVIS